MTVIIQLQYSLADSRVFHAVKSPPNPTHQKLKKNSDPTQPNPWMDPTHDQLWSVRRVPVALKRLNISSQFLHHTVAQLF